MRSVYAAYLLLGLILWPLPLFNVLQVESAAVVAFVSFFVAGWSSLSHFRGGREAIGRELIRQEVALLIPLVMLTISQLWAPNCTFGQGLLFYVLFPGVTVVLAVSVAFAISGTGTGRPYLLLGALGIAVSILGPLYDLGFHPQFYTYNHVFGGVLGPIYDEQLAVRNGLFVFRGMTGFWATTAVLAGRWIRGDKAGGLLLLCVGVLCALYWWAVPLGVNTSAEQIQATLGGHVRTAHFDIYYDGNALSDAEVAILADDHEAAYRQIQTRLSVSSKRPPDRIQSYVYPNGDVKARLTGARTTSITPVWLDAAQVHVLESRVDGSLGHELAHVFSRRWGLPLIQASWAPGLIEGWAVALEPPDPYPSPDDLVSVAATADSVGALRAKAEAISSRLTPWGFWTGRGAVSYATMGSFVGYLLESYGPHKLERVYAWGNFQEVYGQPLDTLAADWAGHVSRVPFVARAAHSLVSRQFTRPSLFERDCPHHLPAHKWHVQEAERAKRRGDSTSVQEHLQSALDVEPQYIPAHVMLARRRLTQERANLVLQQLDTLRSDRRSVAVLLLQGDAHVLRGASDRGQTLYKKALDRTPRYAHDTRVRLMLRYVTARHPETVGILTAGAAPARQAQKLASSGNVGGAVQVWRALRLQAAHRYSEADSLWRRASPPFSKAEPRSWRQEWAVQKRAWMSEAAYWAENYPFAEQQARRAAKQAQRLGAQGWSETLIAWANRAAEAQRAHDQAMN